MDDIKELIRKGVVKTPGELIDALITVDIKCFMEQEYQLTAKSSDNVARHAKKVMELNKKRNRIMRAIDTVLGFEADTATEKTYLKNQEYDLEAEF